MLWICIPYATCSLVDIQRWWYGDQKLCGPQQRQRTGLLGDARRRTNQQTVTSVRLCAAASRCRAPHQESEREGREKASPSPSPSCDGTCNFLRAFAMRSSIVSGQGCCTFAAYSPREVPLNTLKKSFRSSLHRNSSVWETEFCRKGASVSSLASLRSTVIDLQVL